MKKGYKECPFCWEEIKEVAKKCRFCGEFLDWENNISEKEQKNNETTKNYWFLWRFFRKDLKLGKKWWHRFLQIVFYGALILVILWWGGYEPYWKLYHKEADLGERLKYVEDSNPSKDSVFNIKDLIRVLEVIGTRGDCDWNYSRLSRTDKYEEDLSNTYCSSNRTKQKLDNLKTKTWYPFYDNRIEKNQQYIRDYLNDYRNDQRQLRRYLDTKHIYSDTNTVLDFIDKNNIKCIKTDNIVNTDFYFLEYTKFSLKDWDLCFLKDNWVWWRIDLFNRIWIWLIFASILWIICVVFYYKIFIYILYWSYKKK